MSVAAAILLSAAGLSHLMFDHRPGSSAALGPIAFCGEHPALLAGAGAVLVALVLLRVTRPSPYPGKSL